eukprot:scaffold17917_cov46-Phaeocystis_antarctica.AAC.2
MQPGLARAKRCTSYCQPLAIVSIALHLVPAISLYVLWPHLLSPRRYCQPDPNLNPNPNPAPRTASCAR